MRVTRVAGLLAFAVCISLSACADGTSEGPGAGTGGRGGGAGTGGPGGGGGGGRAAPVVVLSATDVYTVARGTVETTTPLSGDLRPIEEILVRSRVEGDLTAVLARDGEPVQAGAVLARFDTAELDAAFAAAEADVAAAKGEAATADWNLEQSRELFRAGAIAEQALKAAEQAALAARARLASAEARQKTAELGRRDANVIAPATGTISQRLVQTGERVSRGAQLFTLVRDDSLELAAAVPARAAGILRVGQEVRFAADGRQFTGRVARISPAVDPASRSVTVFVHVPNRDQSLKANTFASGRVVSEQRREVLTLPLAAVRRSRDDSTVFVYRIEGEYVGIAPVQLGGSDEARGIVEVVQGLAENDRVVSGNVGTIGRGMRVQVLDADRDATGGGRGGRGTRGSRP